MQVITHSFIFFPVVLQMKYDLDKFLWDSVCHWASDNLSLCTMNDMACTQTDASDDVFSRSVHRLYWQQALWSLQRYSSWQTSASRVKNPPTLSSTVRLILTDEDAMQQYKNTLKYRKWKKNHKWDLLNFSLRNSQIITS